MEATPYTPQHGEPRKHHRLTIALHWGTVFTIVVSMAAVLLRELVDDQFWRQVLIEIHRQLGLLVLFGVVVRLGARLRHGMADHMSGLPHAMRLAAIGAHWSLYGLLVGLPLLGWALTNAHNLDVNFIGLIHLPALSEVDSELADQLSDNHVFAAWLLLALVAMHAGAALYHHFIRRDRVLWAMLPSRADDSPDRSSNPARVSPGMIIDYEERD